MSMLSLRSNGSRTKKTPRPTPPGSPGGYTHRVRSRAPFGEETLLSLTMLRPLLGARGLARALRLSIYTNTPARPLAPARPTTPAKAGAQEDAP
jgi:hypothetical protein